MKLSYSVIIPCYNEEGNIKECIQRIDLGKRKCEIIVVNDGSTDNTASVVTGIMKKDKRVKFVHYDINRGKGYATMFGIAAAKNDVLMILDADMTVKPEELPLFMEPFDSGMAEFANGTRMVYPPADQAMRLLHLFGNKVFSMIFTYLLGVKITDTLCGTKCLYRKDYEKIKMKDNAWPDFDLLFGASKLNLRIVEIPIHYQKRAAGKSKMRTFKHGMMLLGASVRGFIELKLKR